MFVRYFLYILISLLAVTENARGQEQKPAPLYIDFNRNDPSYVREVLDNKLSIQYNDAYGRADQLLVKIQDWKRTTVAELSLQKVSGINHYNIDLKDLAVTWVPGHIYSCQTKDEVGKKYELHFRISSKIKKEINVEVFVNPVQMDCEGVAGNVVEFYGDIQGGKAPYTVNWYIMNANRSDFLYQPRYIMIDRPGVTASIQVDKNPDYYVIMHVVDACGNEQHQVVNVICVDGKKKINTLFFESITDFTRSTKSK